MDTMWKRGFCTILLVMFIIGGIILPILYRSDTETSVSTVSSTTLTLYRGFSICLLLIVLLIMLVCIIYKFINNGSFPLTMSTQTGGETYN
jgi:membrane-bound metal-dependent hydrolase YbcI (DUF457 family)